jgi:ADP-ribose pyrophosphatase
VTSHDRARSPGRIDSRRVYTGRVISMDVDTVAYPDGSTGELEMVRHPGASAIVPFLTDPRGDDPQVLLLRQYRYAAENHLFEIPAGRLEPSEAPEQCAVRELREETGCTADRIERLFTMFTTPGFTDEQIHVFAAWGLEHGETARETDEFMSVETVTVPNALELVRTGGIMDAKTSLAILFAHEFRCRR